MTRIALRLSLVSVAVFVFPGCLELALIQALENKDGGDDGDVVSPAYAEPTYDDSYDDTSYATTAIDVRNASLSGDMGDVRDFADDDATHAAYDYGTESSIEIHARATDGSAAMAILEIQGGVGNADIAPGAHYQFANYESTPNGLYMSVIGCSGPSEGEWYFDEQASDMSVDVSATPEGTTVIDFSARFSSGQSVIGSTELGPLQAQ
jgi:hypothetical protein